MELEKFKSVLMFLDSLNCVWKLCDTLRVWPKKIAVVCLYDHSNLSNVVIGESDSFRSMILELELNREEFVNWERFKVGRLLSEEWKFVRHYSVKCGDQIVTLFL